MAAGRGDRSGQAGYTVEIPDMKNLANAIRGAGPVVRREVRRQLKAAGEIVAVEIRGRTPTGSKSWRGHSPGSLRSKTLVRPGATSVRIVNTALSKSKRFPRGYRYGKRLEFDPAFGYDGSVGSSRYAFFYPGLEAKKGEAVARVAQVLEVAGRQFMTGGT